MPVNNKTDLDNMPKLAVSFAIWYKSPVNPEQKYNIIQKGDLTLFCKNNDFYLALPEEMKLCGMPTDSNWHHMVLTIWDTQAFFYMDGKTIGEHHNLATSSVNATDNILIGSAQMNPDFLHRVTLFKHALEMDEVVQLYRRGKDKSVRDIPANPEGVVDYDAEQLSRSELPIQVTASAPLRNAPPLAFPTIYPFQVSLTNQKDQSSSAIYIISDLSRTTDVQNLDLVINNTTKDDFQFEAFTLAFRKGTLHENLTKDNAQKCCEILATAIGGKPQVTAKEEGGSIRFTVKKSATEPFLLKANTALSLALKGIYAAPGTGTRTSGYEVKFEEVQKMAGSNPSGPTFSFGRNAVLQVINHQGNSYAPIHFGVLGNNFLLNVLGAQEIAIFMQSLDGKPLKMDTGTKFIFTFFSGEGEVTYPYFGNRSEVNGIQLGTLTPGFQEDSIHDGMVDEFNKRDIIIIPTAATSTPFAAFKFNNIQLSGPSGLIKVLVTIENLPGYWDSKFEVTFIKGPMVMVGDQVGIGTRPEGINKLSLKGDTKLNGSLTITEASYLNSSLTVKGDTHIESGLSVRGKIGALLPSNKVEINGMLYVNKDIQVGDADENPTIYTTGYKVGVGTLNPKAKLDVEGNINSSGKIQENGHDLLPVGTIVMWYSPDGKESSPPDGWVLCDGSIYGNSQKETLVTPDLRRRFAMGASNIKNDDNFGFNKSGGAATVSLKEQEMPKHHHKIVFEDNRIFRWENSFAGGGGNEMPIYYVPTDKSSDDPKRCLLPSLYTYDTGEGSPHQNLPPYVAIYYIMKIKSGFSIVKGPNDLSSEP